MNQPKKRIMEEFEISEISAVDKPAQTHARVAIMKRDSTADQPGERFEKATRPRTVTHPVRYSADDPKDFAEATDLIRQRDRVSRTEALRRARKAWPNLWQKSQEAGRENAAAKAKEAAKPVQKAQEVVAFEKRIDEVQAATGLKRIDALREAARRFPTELAAYREAQA